jgi:hypothetical protein
MKKYLGLLAGLIAVTILGYLHFHVRPGTQPVLAMAEEEALAPARNGDPIPDPHSLRARPASSASALEVTPVPNTVLARVARGDTNVFKLSTEQVQAFLAKNKTNADSLLAAFNITADPELLREAARRYPSNVLVVSSLLAHDAAPEQRREWIDQFKRLAQANPLPNYLSALDYLHNQQPQQGLQELAEASTKGGFTDYTTDRAQGLEELYLASGYSSAEAKALSTMSVQEPALAALHDLAHVLSTMESQYAAAGDTASATAIAKLGLGLAANISEAGTKSLGTQMLSASAERDFLRGLDPNGTYDFLQQPIDQRLAQLQTDRKAAVDESKWATDWLGSASDSQLVSYFDRMRLYGEGAALKWARTQIGQDPTP